MKKILIFQFSVLILFLLSACKPVKNKKEESMADAIKRARLQEKITLNDNDIIPNEYKIIAPTEFQGTIEHITYQSKNYLDDESQLEKKANVYLPADYSTNKKYKVLYLMHGIGGDENEWGMKDENSLIKKMMDNMAAKGDIEPFIIVTPNGRSGKDFSNPNSNYNAFYKFGKELRNDLIPYIDSHYSTFTDRDHRAMAGLSMGGMQTINIGICESLDLISWFGAFSAAPTSYEASRVASHLNANPDLPIHHFYNICGTEDSIAYQSHASASKLLPRLTDKLTESKNYTWHERMGGHDFGIWNLGFYNFAKIFGKQE